jgi:selenide,water dikinase
MPRATGEFARLLETRDDAAVMPLGDDRCLVQTVDFFTPIVDDPFWFGQIAAANALSDIYAMGARPLTAMNLVAWPVSLGMEALGEILRGGMEKVLEAGAELAGGHSIDDAEPKYGLAVTGVARTAEIVYNGGARAGDRLVLTKRLGIGVLASALKKGFVSEDQIMDAIREAAALNAAASEVMRCVGVHACTDVSGFGLAGHLAEMLDATNGPAAPGAEAKQSEDGVEGAGEAGVAAVLFLDRLPLHDRVLELIAQGVFAGGLRANREYLRGRMLGVGLDDQRAMAVCDPQTSGGLLLSVAPDRHRRLVEGLATAGTGAFTVGEIVAADRRPGSAGGREPATIELALKAPPR